jgi:succinyl-CoA synthetase alpha subunit
MGILVSETSKVVCTGITGSFGIYHTLRALDYGTKIMGVISKDIQKDFVRDIPVFKTIKEANKVLRPDVCIVYSPVSSAYQDLKEAVEEEIPLIVCPTERIPVQDALKIKTLMKHSKSRLIGPASPGIISPAAKCNAGTMPSSFFHTGKLGIMARSSSLTYEAVHLLNAHHIGVSTCVAIGAYPLVGLSFVDCLSLFQQDTETEGILMIGEIGGTQEQQAAHLYKTLKNPKPLLAYIAGFSVPYRRYMGNISAIITTPEETAASKKESLRQAGAFIIDNPAFIGDQTAAFLNSIKTGKNKYTKDI